MIAFDSRSLHASRGGVDRLRRNLPFTVDPRDHAERAEYVDAIPGWYSIVDHPGGKKYPLYRDWAANEQNHVGRQTTPDRLKELGAR